MTDLTVSDPIPQIEEYNMDYYHLLKLKEDLGMSPREIALRFNARQDKIEEAIKEAEEYGLKQLRKQKEMYIKEYK